MLRAKWRIQVAWNGHADRYTYLPHIGLYILVTWAVADWSSFQPKRRVIASIVGGATIVALASLAWLQTSYWRDSESLWTHALAVTSGNDVAHSGPAWSFSGAERSTLRLRTIGRRWRFGQEMRMPAPTWPTPSSRKD